MVRLLNADAVNTYTPEAVTHPDINKAYRDWCAEHGVDHRRANSFSHFLHYVRTQLEAALPESVKEIEYLTFGGADGGSGVLTCRVQGEYVNKAAEAVGTCASVQAFSQKRYFSTLGASLDTDRMPGLCGLESNARGTVLRVQREHLGPAREIVASRPCYTSIAGVHALSGDQYHALLDLHDGQNARLN